MKINLTLELDFEEGESLEQQVLNACGDAMLKQHYAEITRHMIPLLHSTLNESIVQRKGMELMEKWFQTIDNRGKTPTDYLIERFHAFMLETVSHSGRKRLDYIMKILLEEELQRFRDEFRKSLASSPTAQTILQETLEHG